MSSNVEERVVEMQFDNSKFERNANQTIKTLDTLNSSLNLKSSTEGFKNLEAAARKVDLSYLEEAAQAITDKFSVLGVIGDQVLRSLTSKVINLGMKWLTAIPRQALQGGKTRALNIEKAKFQLEGLGIAWKDIYDNIDKAVSGTAYGLDEAATVASQLAASGIAYGDAQSDMAHALRGISGVAAMTNSTYSEIGSIFSTIAGQGKLMTIQLRQLEARGLNAAAKLGEALGKSETEIREMVTKGQIDFITFAKAMDDAFGEHATKANETFTGAFSNMKAAISRIGADFVTPVLIGLRDVFNALREVFNGIRSITKSFAEHEFTEWIIKLSAATVSLIEKLDFSWIEQITSGLSEAIKLIKEFFGLGDKKNLLDGKDIENMSLFSDEIQELEEKSKEPNNNLKNLRKIVAGLGAVLSIAQMGFSAIGNVLRKLSPSFKKVAEKMLEFGASVADWIINLRDSIKASDAFNVAINYICDGIKTFISSVKEFNASLKEFIESHVNITQWKKSWGLFVSFISNIVNTVRSLIDGLFERLKESGGLKNVLNDIFSSIKNLWSKISPILNNAKDAILGIFNGRGIGAPRIISYFTALAAAFVGIRKYKSISAQFNRFKDSIFALFGSFKNFYADIPQKVSWAFSTLGTAFRSWSDNIKIDSIKKIATSILILAVGLAILAAIDSEKLGYALAVAAAGLMALVHAVKVTNADISGFPSISKIFAVKSSYQNIIKLAAALLIIAFSIKVLAKAAILLNDADPDSIVKVIALLGSLTVMTRYMNSSGINARTGLGIIAMAAGIVILASAAKKLENVKVEGLLYTTTLMMAVMLMAKNMNSSGINPKIGIGIIAMAAGILILVKAVEKLSILSERGSLESSIFALGALMLIIAEFSNVLKDTKNIVSVGVSLILFGAALSIMANALSQFAAIEGSIENAIFSVGILFGLIAVFVKIVGNEGTQLLSISAALLVISVSLVVFSSALSVIGNMPTENIVKSLAAIAWLFLILGVSAYVLQPIIPAIMALSGAILILNLAILSIAAAFALLSFAFIQLAVAGAAGAASFAAALSIIANALLATAGTLGQGVAIFAATLIITLATYTDIIVSVLVNMLVSIVKELAAAIPELTKSIVELILTLLDQIVTYTPLIIEGLFKVLDEILVGLASALSNHSENIFSAISDIITSLVSGILSVITDILGSIADYTGELMGAIGGAIGEIVGQLLGGLFEGISAHFDDIATNMDDFLTALSPFFERLDSLNIDKDKVEALEMVAKAILALTAAELLDGIGRIGNFIFGKKSNLIDFADEIAMLGPAMAKYGESVKDVDSEAIKSSAEAVGSLADVAKNLGRSGGAIGLALGTPKTVDQFAKELGAAAPGIKSFASVAPDIAKNEDAIRASADVIGALVDVANRLNPEHTEKLWGAYVQDAQSLQGFLMQFSDITSTSVEVLDNGDYSEVKNIETKGIGTLLNEFAKSIRDIKPEDYANIDTVSTIMSKLAEMGESLQGKESSFSIFGSEVWSSKTTSGLNELLTGLATTAPALKEFISDFDYTSIGKLTNFANAIEILVGAEVNLAEGAGGYMLTTFAEHIKESMDNFYAAMFIANLINTDGINNVVAWITDISDGIAALGESSITAMVEEMKATANINAISTADQIALSIKDQIEAEANIAKFKNAGENLAKGYIEGIESQMAYAASVGYNLSEATVQAMRRALRIYSPSKVTRKIGDFTGEGFVLGLKDWIEKSELTGEDLAYSVTDAAMSALDYIQALLNGELVVDMTIRPVLDLTNIQSGVGTIDAMFSRRQAVLAQIDADSLNKSDEVSELIDVSWQILREIQNGRDIYLDGKVLAGSMNRRLGRMEGL